MRKITGDELFETTGRGVRPTPRALLIGKHVRSILTEVNDALAPKVFEIAASRRTFVVDIGAGFDAVLLPRLYPMLAKEAPGVRLLISNMRGADLLNELKFGQTELAFDFRQSNAIDIRSELVATRAPVVIARADHPEIGTELSEQEYLRLSHVAVVWNRSEAASGIASELVRLGIEIHVVASVPTIAAMGALVEVSDLIATTSEPVGRELARRYNLKVHPIPFFLPNLDLYQLWHCRYDSDTEHIWLRQRILMLGR